jgi:hypothetical protein
VHAILVKFIHYDGGAYADLRWEQLATTCAHNQWRLEQYSAEDFTGLVPTIPCQNWEGNVWEKNWCADGTGNRPKP